MSSTIFSIKAEIEFIVEVDDDENEELTAHVKAREELDTLKGLRIRKCKAKKVEI